MAEVNTIKKNADIAKVIGGRVALTAARRAGDFKGPCPFCQDTGESFNVVPSMGIFHCCAGGDVFRFLMKTDGLSFGEAVRAVKGA